MSLRQLAVLPTLYPRKERRWRRIHTAVVVATFLNVVALTVLGFFVGRFVEDPIYEVNLANVMRNDAELRQPPPQKKVVLAPAPAARISVDPRRGGGAPAPAPAPGARPDRPLAQAPPPLRVDSPRVVDVPTRDVEPQPALVDRGSLPADASDQGNPEGVSGGRGPQDSEGPGGRGTGGTGAGGTGTGGDGGFTGTVNRVVCLGCHQGGGGTYDQAPQPYEIERIMANTRWKFGGSKHPLTLGCQINEQGYIVRADVIVSSGRTDVDQSAIMFVQTTKWYPARRGGQGVSVYAEFPMEVYY